jgi:two-component system chemotaxis response regulator CheB
LIRVLIADDSAMMRRILRKMLEADSDIEVIATARDGNDVVEKARELTPDVITMDVNMPGQDGITALQYIINDKICPVIMVSSLTQEGAVTTFEALELGAFDFIGKPDGTVSSNMESIATELLAKVKAAAGMKKGRKALQRWTRANRRPAVKPGAISSGKIMKVVAMGISAGGPKVIYEVLPLLPPDINAAIFMVQHMPPNFTATYAKRLNDFCQVKVVEAKAGMKVEAGVVYIASGGRHLNVAKTSSGEVLLRLPTKPDHLYIPSVSVMMRSVLKIYGRCTIGVIMTGMGNDGADAMVDIHRAGGITIAESEESAIVFGMPNEAIKRGGAEIIVPIWDIAHEIIKAVNR